MSKRGKELEVKGEWGRGLKRDDRARIIETCTDLFSVFYHDDVTS